MEMGNDKKVGLAKFLSHKKYFFFFKYKRVYFFFFAFFSFIFISWRLITLQYCSGFCHTLT